MIFRVLVALSLCFAASGNVFHKRGVFSSTKSGGHSALTSKIEKSDMKHVVFPEQKRLHRAFKEDSSVLKGTEDEIVNIETFWLAHGHLVGVERETEMILSKEWALTANDISNMKFQQVIHGVRVFAGEFVVTVGSHGGVMSAQGLPAPRVEESKADVDSLLRKAINEEALLTAIEGHVHRKFQRDGKVSKVNSIEAVWHNSKMSTAKQGKMVLAYHVSGSFESPFMLFDAFVDVSSGKLLHFIDNTGSLDGRRLHIEESPFSAPIDATVYVYDQYLKDFNDDKNDYYYYQDPDRYSNYTLVFTTTVANYTYPTSDVEMNYLIDNTLYVKYLYYSLSNGLYLSWNETDTNLNIEYNLTIANAYFDGTWGIHFGSGYITDDVVPHEWSHGYTQTGCGLIYEMESGAMNEAFSDIYGESIDILNKDTVDPDHLRTVWPTSCHRTLNSNAGIPPGQDYGTRWSMGENVTTTYPNGDGSIRDMYKPECFFHPSTTDAPYYSCTTYADGGGVHKNSGVLNRLYAVLTDGGEYTNPADPTGSNLLIEGLGFVKSTNLFWRAHQQLTPTSQYMDLAITLQSVCEDSIGSVLYFPNVFNSTIMESSETITTADCDTVADAITGSGMDSTDDFCPNLNCDDGYDCEWTNCASTNSELYYEDYDSEMGYGLQGALDAVCAGDNMISRYARVFDQDEFDLENFQISCIQFAYFMEGQTNVTLEVYIDTTGGAPDYASLQLVHSYDVTTINAVGQLQVQTVSSAPYAVNFANEDETLVIVLNVGVMSEGYIIGGGQDNGDVVNTVGETYVGGNCREDFTSYYDYCNDHDECDDESESLNQWYVRVHGTSTEAEDDDADDAVVADDDDAADDDDTAEDDDVEPDSESNDDDDKLSSGAVAGISIAVIIVGLALFGGIGYFVYNKYYKNKSLTEPMLNNM